MGDSDYVSGGGAACAPPAHRRLRWKPIYATELVLTALNMVRGQHKPAAVISRRPENQQCNQILNCPSNRGRSTRENAGRTAEDPRVVAGPIATNKPYAPP